MPIDCGHRLAASFPNSRFVEVPDSGTLIPLDQPHLLARTIAEFVLDEDQTANRDGTTMHRERVPRRR